MPVISRRALGGAAAALALSSRFARADDTYPNKFIRFVLPFSPGGGTDTVSRILGEKLGDSLKQSIVIDNRPGAAGNIATKIVATAPKDGYTLLMGVSNPIVVNPALYPDFDVNIQKDLAPICLLAEALFVLVVSPTLPVKSVADLIAYAKANPNKLNYTSGGVGSPLHLAGALFANKTGIKLTHLPFKGGPQAITAILTGEAQMAFASPATSLQFIQAGKLRALAVTSLKRSALLPDLPTMDASGVPGYQASEWYGVLAPSGTPQPVIDKLNANLITTLQQPEVKTSLANNGLSVIGSTPAQFADRIKTETVTWAQVVKDADIKPE